MKIKYIWTLILIINIQLIFPRKRANSLDGNFSILRNNKETAWVIPGPKMNTALFITFSKLQQNAPIKKITFFEDTYLAITESKDFVKIWNAINGELIKTLKTGEKFNLDGYWTYTVPDSNKAIQVRWNPEKGLRIERFKIKK